MKVKISDLVNAKESLNKIYTNSNIPTREAYKIYTVLSKLQPAYDFFEEKREGVFKSIGVLEGENYIIPDEKINDFYQEMNKVGDLYCEEELEKIDISLDIDLGVSPAEIALLTPFINFVE